MNSNGTHHFPLSRPLYIYIVYIAIQLYFHVQIEYSFPRSKDGTVACLCCETIISLQKVMDPINSAMICAK